MIHASVGVFYKIIQGII